MLAATVAGIAAITTGAAALLPGAASDTAREHTTEVTIAGPNEAAGDHPDGLTVSSTEAKDSTEESTDTSSEDTHGAAVSELATSTELTGAEKGAAIAELASDGRSTARGESTAHAADGEAKAAEASANGQEKSAGHRP